MEPWAARWPFRLAGALALSGALALGVAHSQPPPRDQMLLPFRFPELSEDGRTLTVSIVADICGSFDGLSAEIVADTVVVSARASKPAGGYCALDCAIEYSVTRTAAITFEDAVAGMTLVEQPGTPLACADGLGEPVPARPVSWQLDL